MLCDHSCFRRERIIEYCLPASDGPLAKQSIKDFVRNVAARTPAPGGGSVSALLGALGSALGAMVGQMTYGKRQWEEFDVEMRRLIPVVTSAADNMINMIDADTDAFNDYMVYCLSSSLETGFTHSTTAL